MHIKITVLVWATIIASSSLNTHLLHSKSTPDLIQSLFNTGKQLFDQKKYTEALAAFSQLLSKDPNHAPTHYTLALLFDRTGNKIKAVEHAQEALNSATDLTTLNRCSCILTQEDQLEKALVGYLELCKQQPDNHFWNYNAGSLLSILNNHEQALTFYKKAIALNPSHEEARLGFSKALLACGYFDLGWKEFEYRMDYSQEFQRYFKYPDLDLKSLKGKRILLLAEWGLGDTLHFVRYAKKLKELGATVYLQTFDPLVKLLSACPYLDKVIRQGDSLPKADTRIPLLSLPLVFKTTLDTIPTDIPYLSAQNKLVQEWQKKISADKNFKIGLCWHAKPIYLEDHVYTRRSVPLEKFLPLTTIPGISLYSLQKNFGTNELNEKMRRIQTFGSELDEAHGPFMDTAALIKNLDLIISADTSIVHLAGGLGTPTWVLLPYSAEWRWLHDRTDSPWYPNVMRLFRQQKPGDWDTVVYTIATALETLLKEKKSNKKERTS